MTKINFVAPNYTQKLNLESENFIVLETTKYVRKPFYIDAVQVTAENMDAVAKWVEGTVHADDTDQKYIKVRVHRPLNVRQTQAYIGNWVLSAGTGFKVFTAKAFAANFELADVSV